MKKVFVLTALALCAGLSQASVVGSVTTITPDTGTPGGTFQYLNTPPAHVGANNINVNDTLFAFSEQQAVLFGNAPVLNLGGPVASTTRVSSYFVYFDPQRSQHIRATLTFSEAILGVYDIRGRADYWTNQHSVFHSGTGLMGSEDNFGLSNVDYLYVAATGLEAVDRSPSHFSFSGNTLTLDWTASNPGDHIRVLTASAVPEPETLALLLAGLGIMGVTARRKAPPA